MAIYGCVLGAIAAISVFSGLLNPDAHGFGLLIFGEAIWFISGAAPLCRVKEA